MLTRLFRIVSATCKNSTRESKQPAKRIRVSFGEDLQKACLADTFGCRGTSAPSSTRAGARAREPPCHARKRTEEARRENQQREHSHPAGLDRANKHPGSLTSILASFIAREASTACEEAAGARQSHPWQDHRPRYASTAIPVLSIKELPHLSKLILLGKGPNGVDLILTLLGANSSSKWKGKGCARHNSSKEACLTFPLAMIHLASPVDVAQTQWVVVNQDTLTPL